MKKENKLQYRHELKYHINELEKEALISRLTGLLALDTNAQKGQYLIRSLYFDDFFNRAYEEKQAGITDRKKFRIRTYDYSDQLIKLECKRKRNQYIYKESVNLTRNEAEKLISGDYSFLLQRPEALCMEFYVECVSNGMRPKIVVDYERIPYVYYPGDVRITFDMHVRAGILSYDIFDRKLPTLEVLDQGELIMEVKYTEFLPEFIRNILPLQSSEYLATSKYVLCFEKKQMLMQ
jgi:hypothetical protein